MSAAEQPSDGEQVIIRCNRDKPGLQVMPGSTDGRCGHCGAKVWVHKPLLADISQRHPDCDIDLRCMECTTGREGEEMEVLPLQIDEMLGAGLSWEDVAHTFALGEATAGVGTLGETALEIVAHPLGTKARTYHDAYPRYLVMIMTHRSRN